MTQVQFGRAIKKAREASGKTQFELSEKMGYSSPQFLSNFERGLCVLPLPKLGIVCDEIGLSRNVVGKTLIKMKTDKIKKGLGI